MHEWGISSNFGNKLTVVTMEQMGKKCKEQSSNSCKVNVITFKSHLPSRDSLNFRLANWFAIANIYEGDRYPINTPKKKIKPKQRWK